MKTYLVTSNGELFIGSIKDCEKRLLLWSNVVFEKEEDIRIWFSGLEIKHPTSCDKGDFLPLLSRNFDNHLSSNFGRFVIYAYIETHQMGRLVFDKLPKVSSANLVNIRNKLDHICSIYNGGRKLWTSNLQYYWRK